MSSISTHVLDTSLGTPGIGINTILEIQLEPGSIHNETWKTIASGVTNDDGRVPDLIPKDVFINPGVYRITFDTSQYFQAQGKDSFYPYASIVFEIKDSNSHYHVPLLISGFGFSTYRGS